MIEIVFEDALFDDYGAKIQINTDLT